MWSLPDTSVETPRINIGIGYCVSYCNGGGLVSVTQLIPDKHRSPRLTPIAVPDSQLTLQLGYCFMPGVYNGVSYSRLQTPKQS